MKKNPADSLYGTGLHAGGWSNVLNVQETSIAGGGLQSSGYHGVEREIEKSKTIDYDEKAG